MPDLNSQQFVRHRGLLVDTGRAPADNEEILSRISPRPSRSNPDHLYGTHWTTNPAVARTFATNHNAGGYETIPAGMRKFSGGKDRWGVVLDAQTQHDRGSHAMPYSDHEKETRVLRGDVTSVTAHVYDMRSMDTLNEEHPHVPGQTGAGRRRMDAFKEGFRTPARSFEVPESHWRS